MDVRGLDSSIILILRGGILMSIGDFPESLSQSILVGIMLVGRLGVPVSVKEHIPFPRASALQPGVEKLRSAPWFGALRADLPKGLLLRRSVFSQTPV